MAIRTNVDEKVSHFSTMAFVEVILSHIALSFTLSAVRHRQRPDPTGYYYDGFFCWPIRQALSLVHGSTACNLEPRKAIRIRGLQHFGYSARDNKIRRQYPIRVLQKHTGLHRS